VSSVRAWWSLAHDLTSLLFAGLLINVDSITMALRWLPKVAFFHAAFEALAVNELRYLHLHEVKVRGRLDGGFSS
jgi:hypothetical protein